MPSIKDDLADLIESNRKVQSLVRQLGTQVTGLQGSLDITEQTVKEVDDAQRSLRRVTFATGVVAVIMVGIIAVLGVVLHKVDTNQVGIINLQNEVRKSQCAQTGFFLSLGEDVPPDETLEDKVTRMEFIEIYEKSFRDLNCTEFEETP